MTCLLDTTLPFLHFLSPYQVVLRGTSRKVQKSDRALLFVLGSALFFSPQHLLISNVTAFGLPKRENISSAPLSAFPSGEPCLSSLWKAVQHLAASLVFPSPLPGLRVDLS